MFARRNRHLENSAWWSHSGAKNISTLIWEMIVNDQWSMNFDPGEYVSMYSILKHTFQVYERHRKHHSTYLKSLSDIKQVSQQYCILAWFVPPFWIPGSAPPQLALLWQNRSHMFLPNFCRSTRTVLRKRRRRSRSKCCSRLNWSIYRDWRRMSLSRVMSATSSDVYTPACLWTERYGSVMSFQCRSHLAMSISV